MTDKGLSQKEIDYILMEIRKNNVSEAVLALAESDLKSGFGKDQVGLYAGRQLNEANARAMSEALHMGASPKLVKRLAKMDEYRIGIILDELRGGMSWEKVMEVLQKDSSAHGMEELFFLVKEDMAKAEDEESQPVEDLEKDTDVGKETVVSEGKGREQKPPAFSPEDIAKAMEPMLTRLMDGRLNMEIDRLEKKVQELTGDLASSAGVIKNKEDELLRLREEMEKMKERKQEAAAVPKAAKQEDVTDSNATVDHAKAEANRVVTVDGAATVNDAMTIKGAAKVKSVGAVKDTAAINNSTVANVSATVYDSASNGAGTTDVLPKTNDQFMNNGITEVSNHNKMVDGSMQSQDIAGKGISIPEGTYQTFLTTPDGKKIPVQIERTAPRKPKGMLAMAARLFKGTPAQKALLNMLIESRLDPAQLKEIKRAKDSHFTDEELKDLIESDLPADEMAGIIDVIISDR